MGFLTWDETYSVHNGQMDSQHQKLFDLVNELFSGTNDRNADSNTVQNLDNLVKFTMVHFHSEENLMKMHKFPGYNEHKIEHETLIKQILEFQNQIEAGQIELSIRVANFLKEWLENHILISDMKYNKHLKALGF